MTIIPFPGRRSALHTVLLLAISADAEDEADDISLASVDVLTLRCSEMLQEDLDEADIESAIEQLITSGELARVDGGLVVQVEPDRVRLRMSSDPADWVEYRRDGDVIERSTPDATGWAPLDDLRLALLLLYDEEVGTVLRAWGVHRRLRHIRR